MIIDENGKAYTAAEFAASPDFAPAQTLQEAPGWFEPGSTSSECRDYGLLVIMALAYFLPSIVAMTRKNKYKWVIFSINIFAWTLVPWAVAMIWATWPIKSEV